MKPISIEIKNYRSINSISIPIKSLSDGTRTFGLIGVNEAGKSSILKALNLTASNAVLNPKDFRHQNTAISVSIEYQLDSTFKDIYLDTDDLEQSIRDQVDDCDRVIVYFEHQSPGSGVAITCCAKTASGMTILLPDFVPSPEHLYRPIFWTAEEKYLISKPISLSQFAANPGDISIPLRNCFALAGCDDISTAIAKLIDSTEIEDLELRLSESVTNHIKAVWPGHPVKITFKINGDQINFHVRDEGSSGKAKTADQRSDGFRQFISFLLTVSAENKKEQLSNTLLLIDEPEIHLHPKAQQYFLNELKEITKADRKNIVFFATHSTFMIDKEDLSRNFRVSKKSDETILKRFDKEATSYNEVNFEVFEIYSTDYHGELYSKLHSIYQDADEADSKRGGIQAFDQGYFHNESKQENSKPWRGKAKSATLSTYIRNCINHSDNGDKYTEAELTKSILLMRELLGKSLAA